MTLANTQTGEVMAPHPYADKFPMLPEAELAELAESIRANGLRNPVVVTTDGLILDGRNRAAACLRVGIEPETVVYDGDDLAEYVIDCNVTRRNMSTGARAMSTALVLAEDGRRDGGRWKRGSVVGNDESVTSAGWAQRLKEAGVVLDFKPDLASAVVAGDLTLNAAFEQADAIRTSAERDKIMARERKRREKEEAAAEADRNAQIVADLTQANSPHLSLVESGTLTPAAAWAAHMEDTRKERKRREEVERGLRDTATRIAECVRFLDGGAKYGAIFLRDVYPHEQRFLADGMRLTRQRIDSCIEFLQTVREGVSQ